MTPQEYIEKVQQNFTRRGVSNFHQENNVWVAYEGVFKWRWLATKLKLFSFVAYVENADASTFQDYNRYCFDYALKNRPGLPRGLQNGIVTNHVMVCSQATPEAMAVAMGRPEKKWSAFVNPILVDLGQSVIYYYRQPIIWGKIYDGFIKRYIEEHFNLFPGAHQPDF